MVSQSRSVQVCTPYSGRILQVCDHQRPNVLVVKHDNPGIPPLVGAFISALGEGEDHYPIPSRTVATIRPVKQPGGGWALQVSELRRNGTIRQDWVSCIYPSLALARAMTKATAYAVGGRIDA